MAPERLRYSLSSYAKVNIGLYITGKRDDSYHDLATVFQQVSLHDILHFEIGEAGQSEIDLTVCNNPQVSADKNNLVYKAAQAFLEETKKNLTLTMTLEKNIPVGAGLGGGSSNAAVTLLGLNHALGNPLGLKELYQLASRLGADVPFFITGGLAAASGTGDRLRPLDIRYDFTIVLVCPDVAISTKWAYSQIQTTGSKPAQLETLVKTCENTKVSSWPESIDNDFETVVFQEFPQLRALKRRLYLSGAEYASLSGSGSTIFGIFTDRKKAAAACRHFRSPLQYYMVKPTYWGLREMESQN